MTLGGQRLSSADREAEAGRSVQRHAIGRHDLPPYLDTSMRRIVRVRPQLVLPPDTGLVACSLRSVCSSEASLTTKDACRFYDEHYVTVWRWEQDLDKKVVLRSFRPGACRFCGQTEPKVKFRKVAHAFPECTGNRTLTTEYECDDCNGFFGKGIEDDFGKWSLPQRILSGIRGKTNSLAIKDKHWRLQHGYDGIVLSQDEGDPIVMVDEATQRMTLTLPQGPFTPVAVLKTFIKMALSVVPEGDLRNFVHAMEWIRNADHQKALLSSAYRMLYTLVPGNEPLANSAILLRRRSPHLSVPYMVFVFTYGNEAFQGFVPSQMDAGRYGKSARLPFFPTKYDIEPTLELAGSILRERIDLTDRTVREREMVQTVLGYSQRTPVVGSGS
jgi:hypothetical protein